MSPAEITIGTWRWGRRVEPCVVLANGDTCSGAWLLYRAWLHAVRGDTRPVEWSKCPSMVVINEHPSLAIGEEMKLGVFFLSLDSRRADLLLKQKAKIENVREGSAEDRRRA